MKKKMVKLMTLTLAVLMVFSLSSCAADKKGDETQQNSTVELPTLWQSAMYLEDIALGQGEKKIEVEVKADEKSVVFTISTNQKTLADALLENQLVEGDEGPYGLYIKRVNGILADYDEDATYWSLSQNGQAMTCGASEVEISGGERFELTRTK